MLAELKDNLLKAGKSEGCISFTELNKLLPDEIKDPTAIEKVFNFLGANNIEVVYDEDIMEEFQKKQSTPSTIGDLLSAKQEEMAAQQTDEGEE